MLDVNNVTFNTLPNIKDEEFVNFDDFLSEIDDRKESEEERINFQNKCVSSQNKREKEEGATVAASHLPFPAGSFVFVYRPDRQSPRKPYFTGKPHKIPQMSYLRRETPVIFSHLIDSPKQTN